jgi:two-component system, chemotaxis family, CheB/CheR fusion protein
MGDSPPPGPPAATRVIGIGASAGGLVALEQFLQRIPPGSGIACVVVQHLDPTQKALLPELLQRVTAMPVRAAEQDMRIEPDRVYVIPPNTELTVIDGRLQLAAPAEPRGMRLPVNVLFSSLASGQGERAIGVVLSGMGSDGTAGLQAIKAVGGLTAAQSPESAQFDSMPRSAIEAGCVDIVAPPAELPARILAVVAPARVSHDAAQETPSGATSTPLQRIVTVLQRRTRHDFSLYKPSTLHRRAERRMAIHGISSLAKYAEFLEHTAQEGDLLFKELLIGVTRFFRDPAAWECLAEVVLPELLARRKEDHRLRAWVIGCSTGEEAYSLAMVFREVTERSQPHDFTLQIFASDLSPDALATARRGQYPLAIRDDVSPQRLARFFSAHEGHYQLNQNIRDMVLFAQHDVVLDPPFTRLDLIACRNLLIYFGPLLQRRLLPLLHYTLRPGGVLFLGTSETVGRFNHLFTPIQSRLRLYLRQDHAFMGGPDFLLKSFPPLSGQTKEHAVSPPEIPARPTDAPQAAADQVLLQVYAPAAVVLNGDGDIVYISGHTGKYLEPAAGKANWNIFAMAREGLRGPLAGALKKAATRNDPLHLHSLEVSTSGGLQRVDVTVQAFHDASPLRGMTMIVFRDLAPGTAGRGRRRDKGAGPAPHVAELQQYRTEIESLREEARASREELQSANDELQSANEELQSTNEELNSSKEEMQSMNEELQTINAELQAKLDDLALAQSDMQNVLNSIEIAILFLDQNLNVRRFTDRAARIVRLRESDIGRPLSDLTTILQYPDLHEDARDTLRTLASSEKQIATDDGRWFTVRIMPYRRLDNVIDGVVITLVDITETKRLESTLRQQSTT